METARHKLFEQGPLWYSVIFVNLGSIIFVGMAKCLYLNIVSDIVVHIGAFIVAGMFSPSDDEDVYPKIKYEAFWVSEKGEDEGFYEGTVEMLGGHQPDMNAAVQAPRNLPPLYEVFQGNVNPPRRRGLQLEQKMRHLMKLPSDRRFTKDVMRCLWTAEQLQERSVTGQVSRRLVRSGGVAKQALTPRKVAAVKSTDVKTHKLYDEDRVSKQVKYVYIARNPQDCCVPYHHYKRLPANQFEDAAFEQSFE
ncbi:hypothetical protein HPB47_015271 [Ixodes persulcatus]|uniref:Uncharacterized protein n=1 Tax=Ixodes persulcatus TaxID=34615 RepID=A0AC60QUT9_IXOPE|nr:hypothetical protein HPB47_015271 [Ixodes persulcatus]